MKKILLGLGIFIFIGISLFIFILILVRNQANKEDEIKLIRHSFHFSSRAIENFYIEQNHFPPDGKRYFGILPSALTTPISYLRITDRDGNEFNNLEYIVDPFQKGKNRIKVGGGDWFDYLEGGILNYYTNGESFYFLLSPGPDRKFQFSQDLVDKSDLKEVEKYYCEISYDPTNGLVSEGDILVLNEFNKDCGFFSYINPGIIEENNRQLKEFMKDYPPKNK